MRANPEFERIWGGRASVKTSFSNHAVYRGWWAASGQPRRFEDMQALTKSGGVRLEISDSGCGMTEEIQAKIFDPFFATKFAGRGLGLAAVHGIIRSHGGAINVISAPGRGSRFEILMPRGGQPVQDAGGPPVPADETGSFAGTILVVEDQEALRSPLSQMLRRTGWTVIEAADGQTGIDQFQAGASKTDLVSAPGSDLTWNIG